MTDERYPRHQRFSRSFRIKAMETPRGQRTPEERDINSSPPLAHLLGQRIDLRKFTVHSHHSDLILRRLLPTISMYHCLARPALRSTRVRNTKRLVQLLSRLRPIHEAVRLSKLSGR